MSNSGLESHELFKKRIETILDRISRRQPELERAVLACDIDTIVRLSNALTADEVIADINIEELKHSLYPIPETDVYEKRSRDMYAKHQQTVRHINMVCACTPR